MELRKYGLDRVRVHPVRSLFTYQCGPAWNRTTIKSLEVSRSIH